MINFVSFVDDALLPLCSCIVLSSSSSWHCVETTAANKRLFFLWWSFNVLVTWRKWHMFAPFAAFFVFSQKEGGSHAFIHHFLEVLVLVSQPNEQNEVGHHGGNVLGLFLCVLLGFWTYILHSRQYGTSFLSVFFFFATEFSHFSFLTGFASTPVCFMLIVPKEWWSVWQKKTGLKCAYVGQSHPLWF